MNIVRIKPLESWKSCAGLCMICGIPLGLEPSKKMMKEALDLDEIFDEEEDEIALEENFVRVSLFKYNLLGKMDACHIIDQYTFLKPKQGDAFKKALQDNKPIIQALGGNLLQEAFKNEAYEKASDYCQRVAAKRVVPGCRACNTAMNRSNTHADIVYRCFGPSSALSIPELEDSTTKTGRVISKGNVIKKLIQQIAFYFTLNKEGAWEPKDEELIMSHAALWRCIANLCMWGKNGAVRFGLISIFYGAVYIFERLKLADIMLFTDWHLHVFRNFYMETYPEGTWFGMKQDEATVKFDTTRKDGMRWWDLVQNDYLNSACDSHEAFFTANISMPKISQFKDLLLLNVFDEKTLFIFLCKKCGPKDGIHTLMNFFLRNFQNPRSILLIARADRFIKEIRGTISKELSSSLRASTKEITLDSP